MIGKQLTLLLLILSFVALGQQKKKKSREEFEAERKEILQKINNANKILNETKHEKRETETKLRAIKEQIQTREQYLESLNKEISLISEEEKELLDVIRGMQTDLQKLKEEYAHMIYVASKANNSLTKLMFLFSASNYNQLSMRLKYLTQFADARKHQVRKIELVKASLEAKEQKLRALHQQKNGAIQNVSIEKSNLDNLKKQQTQVFVALSDRETEFSKKIKDWKKEQIKLESLIKATIESEIKKSNKTVAEKGKDVITERLSANFAANKSKFPWPLSSCFVSRRFGTQPHPVLEKVYVENMGVGLQTERGAKVKVIFDGVVSTVASIPGLNKVVMVKHGEYFTVYAKMNSVNVTTGQKLSVGDVIGTVQTNDEGDTELEFQLWKGREKLNPELWLKK